MAYNPYVIQNDAFRDLFWHHPDSSWQVLAVASVFNHAPPIMYCPTGIRFNVLTLDEARAQADKITPAELVAMFGTMMPVEVAAILSDAPSPNEAREQLKKLAFNKREDARVEEKIIAATYPKVEVPERSFWFEYFKSQFHNSWYVDKRTAKSGETVVAHISDEDQAERLASMLNSMTEKEASIFVTSGHKPMTDEERVKANAESIQMGCPPYPGKATNNEARCGFARSALEAFVEEVGENGTETDIGDLICNLLHLAASEDISPAWVLKQALSHFVLEAIDGPAGMSVNIDVGINVRGL